MTVRDLVHQAQVEIRDTPDLLPDRAAAILTQLSALLVAMKTMSAGANLRQPVRPVRPAAVWALVDDRHRVRGGDFRPHVYWTLKQAKLAQRHCPERVVVPVEIALRMDGPSR